VGKLSGAWRAERARWDGRFEVGNEEWEMRGVDTHVLCYDGWDFGMNCGNDVAWTLALEYLATLALAWAFLVFALVVGIGIEMCIILEWK
jgi:hypothetical protein